MRFRGVKFAVAALLLIAGSSQAATITYQFGELLSPSAAFVDPSVVSPDFATLAIDFDTWTFRLTASDLSMFGAGSFIGALAIDGDVDSLEVLSTSSGSGIAQVSYSNGGGPTGIFDFRFDLTGPKGDRLVSGEWVEWTVAGISSLRDLALHVQGIDSSIVGDESAWYSAAPAPIPLPAAGWLLGSSLLGLFGLMRRRSRTRAAVVA